MKRRGFTVAELLVAVLAGMLLMAAVLGALRVQTRMMRNVQEAGSASAQIRMLFHRMAATFSDAGLDPLAVGSAAVGDPPAFRLVEGDAGHVVIRFDADRNGRLDPAQEEAEYVLTAGQMAERKGSAPALPIGPPLLEGRFAYRLPAESDGEDNDGDYRTDEAGEMETVSAVGEGTGHPGQRVREIGLTLRTALTRDDSGSGEPYAHSFEWKFPLPNQPAPWMQP